MSVFNKKREKNKQNINIKRLAILLAMILAACLLTSCADSGGGLTGGSGDQSDSTRITGMTEVKTPDLNGYDDEDLSMLAGISEENPEAEQGDSAGMKNDSYEDESGSIGTENTAGQSDSEKKDDSGEGEDSDSGEADGQAASSTTPQVVQLNESGKVVCIDAGHQAKQNSGQEPIGPGASTTKPKVSSGTSGVSTGIAEYQLTLILAQKVQTILEQQGYTVIMCRTSHDVDLSNSERAAIANNAGANAFVRIHADGNNDSSVHGCTALCQTSSNPYNGNMYSQSRALASSVVNNLAAATGARNRGITETDSMSGINWASVPVCIIEVGFMSNPTEDQQMATEEYRNKIATGIANGIMEYLNQ